MRIAIITDAWRPQINGVVTTLSRLEEELAAVGHDVAFLTPQGHPTVGLPSYREIRLAVLPYHRLARQLEAFAPGAIHIATEGPLGQAARRYCLRRQLPFTTAYHTQFPRYLRMRAPVPEALTYRWLRGFHAAAARTLVPTPSVREELTAHGFEHLAVWSRGVDTRLFRPRDKGFHDLPRPVSVYVGRVAVEKNLEAFLGADIAGTRMVVGDGPDRAALARRYPDAVFVGYRQGEDLARHVAAADVLVFPSRSDTFGLTILEAMACGVPVAAFPVTGPKDLIRDGVTGALDGNLTHAVQRALAVDPSACLEYARAHTWQACAESFCRYLEPIAGQLAQTVTP